MVQLPWSQQREEDSRLLQICLMERSNKVVLHQVAKGHVSNVVAFKGGQSCLVIPKRGALSHSLSWLLYHGLQMQHISRAMLQQQHGQRNLSVPLSMFFYPYLFLHTGLSGPRQSVFLPPGQLWLTTYLQFKT